MVYINLIRKLHLKAVQLRPRERSARQKCKRKDKPDPGMTGMRACSLLTELHSLSSFEVRHNYVICFD